MTEVYEACPRRMLVLTLVLDTSASMAGESIQATHESLERIAEELKTIQQEEPGIDLRVALLRFDNTARWLTDGAQSVDAFFPPDLPTGGMTAMGEALERLNLAFSDRSIFRDPTAQYYRPIVIFMTDGYPTDHWEAPLYRLQQNRWYRRALKMAIAYRDADERVLSAIVGDDGAVVPLNHAPELGGFLRQLSVTSVRALAFPSDDPIYEDADGRPILLSGKDIVRLSAQALREEEAADWPEDP